MLSTEVCSVGYSYLTVRIKVRYVGGMGLRVCACACGYACVCVTMLMRTIIFLHLESISRDYDDGLPQPYYYQD